MEEHLYCLMAMCQENSRNWLVKIESCCCENCINLKKNFSVQYSYKIKQTSDQNNEKGGLVGPKLNSQN